MEVFSETLEVEITEEVAEESTRGAKKITVANATLDEIEVVLDETTLVREVNKREKHLAVGFSPLEANANIELGVGQSNFETLQSKSEAHNVGPHDIWQIPVAPSSVYKKGQAMNMKNSIQIFLNKKGSHQQEKIGSYLVGPGHGLIVSKINNKYRTEQAKGRSWLRVPRFDPWLNNLGTSRDPHSHLARKKICNECGFRKK